VLENNLSKQECKEMINRICIRILFPLPTQYQSGCRHSKRHRLKVGKGNVLSILGAKKPAAQVR
jgi:hypothetical protein